MVLQSKYFLLNNVLYIVATPIGNRGDMTERAKQTLASVDVVLCEDTRVTAKLCSMLEITPTLHTFHEHTDDHKRAMIIADLVAGKHMALVTDAGTPGISDPGGMLVADAVAAGVRVVSIPGASAVTTALSVCGFPTARFTFVGFPPQKKGRETFFRELGEIAHTIVLYESTHRIEKTLEALGKLGRQLCVCRELTKMHETIYRGSAQAILGQFAQTSTKGEFVIVIAPR